jgi:deoxyribonuclease IV
MPMFGAHLSVAGGLHKAVDSAVALNMETVQIFTHSPSQWVVKGSGTKWAGTALAEADVAAFRTAVAKAKLNVTVAHDSYLINLAAPGEELFEKSIAAFSNEIERAEQLGLTYLVTHPGAHVGSGEEVGLQRVIVALNRVLNQTRGAKVVVLLETTAGQGTTLGWKFEHLQTLLNGVTEPERMQVCVDTCHLFAAGYGLATKPEYEATMTEFDRLIGLDRIKLFHVNDSVKGLGSRVDRHAGLGEGKIGSEAFKLLVNDPRFADRPMILETPKENADGDEMDPINLDRLRQWQKNGKSKRKPAVS